jgi:hypothetical protein
MVSESEREENCWIRKKEIISAKLFLTNWNANKFISFEFYLLKCVFTLSIPALSTDLASWKDIEIEEKRMSQVNEIVSVLGCLHENYYSILDQYLSLFNTELNVSFRFWPDQNVEQSQWRVKEGKLPKNITQTTSRPQNVRNIPKSKFDFTHEKLKLISQIAFPFTFTLLLSPITAQFTYHHHVISRITSHRATNYTLSLSFFTPHPKPRQQRTFKTKCIIEMKIIFSRNQQIWNCWKVRWSCCSTR